MAKTLNSHVRRIRAILREQGSAEHAAGVQWFFKEPVLSHGWYTGDLRRLGGKLRREILAEGGLELLLDIADRLFNGKYLEERGLGIILLQKDVTKFGDQEFKLLESWLPRIICWADHDGLVCFLIGPMLVADPRRVRRVFSWAKSSNRWFRRASAVALIPGVRKKIFFEEVHRLFAVLERDQEGIVQKGLGWLLRETAKFDPERTVPFLMKIRDRAPRLVLRTACETLPASVRAKIVGPPRARSRPQARPRER